MWGFRLGWSSVCLLSLVGMLSAQTPARVDFAKEVMPILRQNCVPCHGPAQQSSGMRLDRRSVVLGRRGVVPGSSENSFLYHRISGNDVGLQMPPTGPLRPEQIQTIKTWIEQGADWPDALANEIDLPPSDPKAVALVDMLHVGDLPGFMKSVEQDPKLLNARGPEGSTPFMYAALYTGVPTLQRLLKLGADVNKRNDVNATALMWAATDLEKVHLLLEHGGERVKITDFGLARAADDASISQSGIIAGTPMYMAPEQAKGRCWTTGPTCSASGACCTRYSPGTRRSEPRPRWLCSSG